MTSLSHRAEEIITRYLAGESMRRIGHDFGVTKQAVHRVLAAHGVTPLDQRAALDRRVAALHAQGFVTSQIATSIARSDEWVQTSLRRQHLPTNWRPRKTSLTPEQVQDAIGLHRTGMTVFEIGAVFHVSGSTISEHMIRAGHRTMTRMARQRDDHDACRK